ncbi:MAG TPA: phosphoethanolamine--lipid A transferase [Noviherbaspirillum sp.]|nr:phosphoethanolamine--lipid A transferase [Noviherbaspirillum sp.]
MVKLDSFKRPNAALLPLLASAFIVSVYNQAFWKSFSSATGGLTLAAFPVQAGMFLMLVLTFTASLATLNFRFSIKPLLIGLFLVTSLASYFMNHYGVAIDWSMVQNIAETDSRESTELFNAGLGFSFLITGVIPAAIIAWLKPRFQPGRRQLGVNLATAGIAVVGAGILLMLMFKILAPALREHRELRFLLTPTNYIQAVNGYFKRKWSVPVVVAPLGRDATKGVLWRGNTRRTVTVVVVGETARAANFSLNGYSRLTNPELSQVPDLVNFKNMQSCGTATGISLPCLFSPLGRENYSASRAQSQEGLLDVLQHAGLKLLWRDNNSGCKGVCDRIPYEDVSQPIAGDPFCNNEECFDERLLRGLPQQIRDGTGDMVIVLHQKGSHGPAYSKRYPQQFSVFGPVCNTIELGKCTRQSIVDAYDNTIRYTDHVLKQAIDLLAQAARDDGVDTALMYFSDHGESLGENNFYLHGAPYVISPPEQRAVPFMLWLSAGFRERFKIDQRCLAARVDQPFSHDNLFHSTLGMLNVSTAVYNPRLDIFNACRHAP